jgi:SagB-type dehydrogenase family enzyme
MTPPVAGLALLLQFASLELPPPARTGGKPLYEALAARQTSRTFSTRRLPSAALSNLLWAAYGINRPATGGRTAPSAHNWQTIEVYAVIEPGIYLYEPKTHRLRLVAAGDHRPLAGTQDFVNTAPLNLVYVASLARTQKAEGDTDLDIAEWVAAEAGAIAQNVALACASEGLGNVVRAGVQRERFSQTAKLPAGARIVLAQTVGYPE